MRAQAVVVLVGMEWRTLRLQGPHGAALCRQQQQAVSCRGAVFGTRKG